MEGTFIDSIPFRPFVIYALLLPSDSIYFPTMQIFQVDSEIDVPTTNGEGASPMLCDEISSSDAKEEECGQQHPVDRFLVRLSKLSVDWRKIPEKPEHHDGKNVFFCVNVKATMSTGATASIVFRLPCEVELDVKGGGRLVEALFVIRNKRGCVFAVFDAVNQIHFFAKPNEITTILEFLPNRVAMARGQIGKSIQCMNATKSKKGSIGPKGTKRGRVCDDWQGALLTFCACILGENGSTESRERFESLKKCLTEETRPTKSAKSTLFTDL